MYSQVRGLSHNIYIVFSIEMNRWCEYMEDVYAKIDSLKAEQKEIMRDIRNLETRTTINEKDIATINKQLEKISTNITWILRIIISAIVMSVLGLILKGMI
ncbi:XpaF1 protein [Bacillus cereus HuA3-9]|jgi:tRNA C32,U32 (ribose-2'-O)-methylase TrmJ|uniref:XpaF1 protein n=2 Tax=Bacillus cereus group TaxID=86661 RepID=R8CGV5_BACCE|nr:XpaF1 protein [Bacillus cereus VD142]EOO10818.1 XpaF1 protein [Bacillus cereus HuA3-9]